MSTPSARSLKRTAVALILAFSACTQVAARGVSHEAVKLDNRGAEERSFVGRKTVVETVVGMPEKFGALTAALIATNLVEPLNGLEEATVIAPLNEAFCRLGARVLDINVCKLDDFFEDCTANCWGEVIAATKDSILSNVLLSHVVVGNVSLRDLRKARFAPKAITTLGVYIPNGEPFFFQSETLSSGEVEESVLCKVLGVFQCFPLYSGDTKNNLGYVKNAIKATNGIIWPIDSVLDPLTAQ